MKNIFCCVLTTLGSDSVFGQQPAFAGAPEGPLLIVLAFVGLFSEADKSALEFGPASAPRSRGLRQYFWRPRQDLSGANCVSIVGRKSLGSFTLLL